MAAEDDATVVAQTQRWIERAVIGLNLCPFARTAFESGGIRYVVSSARDADALAADLDVELRRLHGADPAECETALLIHPRALRNFLDYNDFLDVADATLDALDLVDDIQIASFHPGLSVRRHVARRRRELHQPFTVSDAASIAAGERRPRGGGVSGHGDDLRIEHRDAAPTRARRLAQTLVATCRRKRVMKSSLVIACVLFAASVRAEEIGEVDTVFKLVGPDHKIVVDVYDDPKVTGVACYVSRAKTGGMKGAVGVAEDLAEAPPLRAVRSVRFRSRRSCRCRKRCSASAYRWYSRSCASSGWSM